MKEYQKIEETIMSCLAKLNCSLGRTKISSWKKDAVKDNARDAKKSSFMHNTLQELMRDFGPKTSAIRQMVKHKLRQKKFFIDGRNTVRQCQK